MRIKQVAPSAEALTAQNVLIYQAWAPIVFLIGHSSHGNMRTEKNEILEISLKAL
jgi:hypothetical protein